MNYDIPEQYQKAMQEAIDCINKHQCTVDTLLVGIGDEYYGYQPYPQPQKGARTEIADARQKELSHTFDEAQKILAGHKIDLLVCFTALNEGGAMVFVAQEAVKQRINVFEELKKMEAHHAKVS